jgi:hypothetical protein
MIHNATLHPHDRTAQRARQRRRWASLAHRLILVSLLTGGLGLSFTLAAAPSRATAITSSSLASNTPQDTQGGPWVP